MKERLNELNTHGVEINFGKHKGELLTRLPVSYLKWMVNKNAPMHDLAAAELKRRNHSLPAVELSGHAIDNASLRVRKIWHCTRLKDEGLYSWLSRMVLEAIEKGKKTDENQYFYNGMKLVIEEGEEFPALKTVMRKNVMPILLINQGEEEC